jgi:predicted alternative tryptophan synthase beta-subunit
LFPQKQAVLSRDAVPTKFLNVPVYLSSNLPTQRKEPEKRQKLFEEEHKKHINEFLASDIISDFDHSQNSYIKYVCSMLWKFQIEESLVG